MSERIKTPKRALKTIKRLTPYNNHHIPQRTSYNIRPLISVDRNKLASELSEAFAKLKAYSGHILNAAMFCWREAYYDIIKTPLYRHKAKAAFNQVIAAQKKWENDLKHPSPDKLRFFSPSDIDADLRKRYRDDMTIDDYFEFWQSTGGEVYAKSAPQLKSLRYKFERILNRLNVPHAKTISKVLLANAVLQVAETLFNSIVKQQEQNLTPLSTPYHILCQDLYYTPVYTAWRKAVELLKVDIAVESLEDKDVETSYTDIINHWTDDIFLNQCTISAIEAYDTDIIRSHGTVRKLTTQISNNIEEIKRDNFEARKKRILCDN